MGDEAVHNSEPEVIEMDKTTGKGRTGLKYKPDQSIVDREEMLRNLEKEVVLWVIQNLKDRGSIPENVYNNAVEIALKQYR